MVVLAVVVAVAAAASVAVMGENEHDFRAKRGANHHDIRLKQAYLEANLDKVNIMVGRFGIGVADGNVLDDDLSRMDSVLVGYEVNDKVKVEGFAAQALDGREDEFQGKKRKMYGGRVTYTPLKKLEVKGEYVQFKDFLGEVGGNDSNYKNKVFALSANYEVVKDLAFGATYIRGNGSGDEDFEAASKNGVVLELGYKGAEAEEKGDSGEKDHRFWTDVTFTF